MEQRDYILREIEKISILILGMLGKLKAFTKSTQFEQEREVLFEEFEETSGVSIDDILDGDPDQIKEMLTERRGFNSSNIDALSDLLFEFSFNLDSKESKLCIKKAILLLEWLAREEKTFDLERERRLSEYRNAL